MESLEELWRDTSLLSGWPSISLHCKSSTCPSPFVGGRNDLTGATARRNRQPTIAGSEKLDLLDSEEERKQEAARLVTEIQELAARLEPQARQNGAVARLQQYLDALHRHALTKSAGATTHVQEHAQANASPSMSGAPDSAIELCDDQHSPLYAKRENIPSIPRSPITDTSSIRVDEVDEILDELREMRRDAPIPPPRSARRTPHGTPTFDRSSNAGSYTASVSSGYRSLSGNSHHSTQGSWQRSVSHARSWSLAPSEAPDSIYEGYSTPATEVSCGQSGRDSGSLEKVRPDSETIGQPLDFSRFSRFENPRANVPVPPCGPSVRPSTSSSSTTNQSGRMSNGMVRRSSSRLSMALRGLRIGGRRSSSSAPSQNRVPMPPPPLEPSLPDSAFHFQVLGSLPVFGVPLAQSMQVAKGVDHDGNTSSKEGRNANNNTREYPLCVLRCVYFIQDQGLETPDIFGQDGNQLRLSELKEIFSSIDTGYGKILDWCRFTVHEAADLILLFLSELPTPLVPESVAKRWLFLSRQATVAGSMAMRLDQGIDFWEEAFLGIHGASRALLRLLLNLWGDIVDMSEFNDMTAERLAERTMRPLVHLPAARFETDLMLGLAFMIRKRSEYRMKAKGTGRKRNAVLN